MLKIITLTCILIFYSNTAIPFNSGEHQDICKKIKSKVVDLNNLTLANNKIKLSCGDIIGLAGDYFGNWMQPISVNFINNSIESIPIVYPLFINADLLNHKNLMIINNYVLNANTLIYSNNINEISLLIKEFNNEIMLVNYFHKKNKPANYAYNKYDKMPNYSTITNLRYLFLAGHNIDHFGDHAINAYIAGHSYALSLASKSYQLKDKKLLKLAYLYEIYSFHFLTDRFASGHINTDQVRDYFYKHCVYINNFFSGLLSVLITNKMHDFENNNGFLVFNKYNRFLSIGDSNYFDEKSFILRNEINKAVQSSIDELDAVSQGRLKLHKGLVEF